MRALRAFLPLFALAAVSANAHADMPIVMVQQTACTSLGSGGTAYSCDRFTPSDLATLPPSVEYLELRAPAVAPDTHALASKPRLSRLVITPDIQPYLSASPSIRQLTIRCDGYGRPAISLDAIHNMGALQNLTFENCSGQTARLEELAGTNLVHIDTQAINVTDLTGLERVPSLQSIFASSTPILLPRANANLRQLVVRSSHPVDLTKLRNATSLEKLAVHAPNTDLSSLGGLPITNLQVDGDTDFGPVLALRKLDTLVIDNGRAPSPIDLRALAFHPTLKHIAGQNLRARTDGVRAALTGFQPENATALVKK